MNFLTIRSGYWGRFLLFFINSLLFFYINLILFFFNLILFYNKIFAFLIRKLNQLLIFQMIKKHIQILSEKFGKMDSGWSRWLMNKVIDSIFLLFCKWPPDICSLLEHAGVEESFKIVNKRDLITPSESTRRCGIFTPKTLLFFTVEIISVT